MWWGDLKCLIITVIINGLSLLILNTKIKVLIVDDSALVRAILRDLLENDPEIEVIGEASNGIEALEQVLLLKPDIVTMDLEMPVMGGHEAIKKIMAIYAVPILVISSLDDAKNACAAIASGALDLIGKPQLESLDTRQFIVKVKMLSQIKVIKHLQPACHTSKAEKVSLGSPATTPQDYEIFAIASSTGGPRALESILQGLPADFPTPIVIAQHISEGFEQGMADWLHQSVPMTVKIAEDFEPLKKGHVYLSPANRPLCISANRRVKLTEMCTTDIYHPNCNVLLNSVAQHYTNKSVGIICTGMGSDGAQGMEAIRHAGGLTLAQDEASSVVFGMNQVAIMKGCIQEVLSLEDIATKMLALTARRCGLT